MSPTWIALLVVFAVYLLLAAAVLRWTFSQDVDDILDDLDAPVPYEPVEQFADRELQQFECPHLDQAEIDRLRAVARRQAAEVTP